MQMHVRVLRLIFKEKSEIIEEKELGLFESQGEECLRANFESDVKD